MHRASGKLCLLIVLIFLITSFSSAQTQTGSITGMVTDESDQPLPGASVTLAGPAMMGTRVYSTTINGDFRFPAVPPGKEYSLTIEMPGFQASTREGITVNVGKSISLRIKLVQSTIEESVVVRATPPVVDIKNAKLSVNYSDDLITNVPLERDYIDVIKSAPGVISGPDDIFRTFVANGGTTRSNQIALDGVNVVDPYSGVNKIDMSFDIYEDFEMELSSHPAEVGMTDGAYINIVTKSGGNEFHGQASIYFFNDSMVKSLIPSSEAEAVGLEEPSGYKRWLDTSFSIGGPLVRDKLWFFANGRYVGWKQNAETLPDGSFDVNNQQIMTFAKLTYNPTPSLKFVGMWSFSNMDQDYFKSFGIDYYQDAIGMQTINNSQDHAVTGMVNWIAGQNTFFDGRLIYYRTLDPYHLQPELPANASGAYDFYTNITSGPSSANQDHTSNRLQLSLNGAHFLDDIFAGNHEIKVGVEIERSSYKWDHYIQNPYFFYTYQGLPWAFHNFQPYLGTFDGNTNGASKGDMVANPQLRRFGIYLQDKFTIKNRLTLNLGIRYDESHGDMLGGRYSPAGKNDPVLTMLAPDVFKDTTVEDATNVIVWRDISPRLGAVLDVFGDGKTALKAAWSRYHEYLRGHYYAPMSPLFPNAWWGDWYDSNKDGIIDTGDEFDEYHSPNAPDEFTFDEYIDPNLKSPRVDEFMIGIEREIFRNFTISLSYINKKKSRIINTIEKYRGNTPDSGWWLPYTAAEPGWDGVFGTEDDGEITVYGVKQGAPPSQEYLTNPEQAERKYQALELNFNKRMSNRWQLLASLILSKYEGNINADMWATWGYRDWLSTPNWFVNRYGRVDFDRPVQIKILGSVVIPYDIMLSGYFIHMSGAPWARTLKIQLPEDPSFEYPGTFVEWLPTNAEAPGSRRYRSRNNLDLRIEKTFPIRAYGRLGFFLDILNVFGESLYLINEDPGGNLYADGTFEQWPWYGQFTGAFGLRTFKLSARFTF